jgi:hypothetical protein
MTVGATHRGERGLALVSDRGARALWPEGRLPSQVVIDPDRIYQPQRQAIVSGMS